MPGQSAINDIGRAGEIVGILRCQEGRKTHYVFWLAKSTERDLADQGVKLCFILEQVGFDGCFDRGRALIEQGKSDAGIAEIRTLKEALAVAERPAVRTYEPELQRLGSS